MIKLRKGAKPSILVEKESEWTKVLTDKQAQNVEPTSTEKTRYRHPKIKEELVRETSGKCAYCESKLRHIHHGDVEHIYPKSLAIEKTFEWENLTLACEICNQNKSNNDPFLNHIIDPYRVNPASHLKFLGCMIFPLGSREGISTCTILELHRGELVEERKRQLEKVMGIFSTILRTDLPLVARRAMYKNLLATEASSAAPYSAMAQAVIDAMAENLPSTILEAQ